MATPTLMERWHTSGGTQAVALKRWHLSLHAESLRFIKSHLPAHRCNNIRCQCRSGTVTYAGSAGRQRLRMETEANVHKDLRCVMTGTRITCRCSRGREWERQRAVELVMAMHAVHARDVSVQCGEL